MESSVIITINSLIFMALLCLCMKSYYTPDFLFQFAQLSKHVDDHDELESVLSKASKAHDNTVIIAIVNRAYVEGDYPMLDLFLDSFKFGDNTSILFNHLILVAIDQTSFEKCKSLRLVHCYKLETDGVDFEGEKVYMSDDFIRMMWRRTMFLGEVLKRGYNFVFTDTDVMWLRNPFARLSNDQNIDLQISTDSFNGDPRSEANIINTGFYVARSNNKTISLFDAWFARKENSTGMKEQDVLQRMIQEGVFKELRLGVRFLDTLYFSGFCEVSKDFAAVTTVHANCCRTISAKLIDLRNVINDWKRFRSLTLNSTALNVKNITSTLRWSKHVACEDSWKT